MSDSLIWVSAQLPLPFQPNAHVQMWWQEKKAPKREGDQRSPSSRYGPWLCSFCKYARHFSCRYTRDSCSTRSFEPQAWQPELGVFFRRGRQLPGHWLQQPPISRAVGFFEISTSSAPGRSFAVDLTCQLATRDSRFLPRMPISRSLASRPVGCPLRLRVDDAFGCFRGDDTDWINGWRTQLSCSPKRHAALVTHLFTDQEPASVFKRSVALPVLLLALIPAAVAQLTTSSCFSGTLVVHVAQINALWRTTSMDPGTSSATRRREAS